MGPGAQLIAPEGLGPLEKGIVYFLFATRSPPGSVMLAWFERGKEDWLVHFMRIDRTLFESALLDGRLQSLEVQAALPFWLAHFEGVDIHALNTTRHSKKVSYSARIDYRYEQISVLVGKHEEIVRAEDPFKVIRRLAKESGSKQKPERLGAWYAVYTLFAYSKLALLPSTGGIGKWKRSDPKHADTKFGRPNQSQGKHSGWSAIPLAGKIISSFYRFSTKGVPMAQVWRKALEKVFGCKARKDERGIHEYYHPQGKAFPTLVQYTYRIETDLGLPTIRRRKLGDVTYRNRYQISQGPFSESAANVCERTETDGYFSLVAPTALLGKGPDLPLVTCRIVCLASGMVLGTGSAYGREDGQAYRSMLFCAAIDKQHYARIIGLKIGPLEYPSKGLPLKLVADRGAGSTGAAAPAEEPALLPNRNMTPSHAPQSKATVEASHRRHAIIEGPPEYIQGSLTAIEMHRREFMQAIADNNCSDASSRLDFDMIADDVPGHPAAIYRWMDSRGRSAAYEIPFEQAVRNFLEPVEFVLDSKGLWLMSQRYDSPAFIDSEVRARVRKGQRVVIPGFVLPLCVRTAWIDTGTGIIEVDAQLPVRGDEEQLYISLKELEVYSRKVLAAQAENRRQAPAAQTAAAQVFEEQTGKAWDGGKRKSGRKPSRKLRGRTGGVPSPPRRKRRR